MRRLVQEGTSCADAQALCVFDFASWASRTAVAIGTSEARCVAAGARVCRAVEEETCFALTDTVTLQAGIGNALFALIWTTVALLATIAAAEALISAHVLTRCALEADRVAEDETCRASCTFIRSITGLTRGVALDASLDY